MHRLCALRKPHDPSGDARLGAGVTASLFLALLVTATLFVFPSSVLASVAFQASGGIQADADPHTDHSVTLPAHATGDLLILMAFVRDADETAAITVATGWTPVTGFPVDRGTSARYWCWYKFATSASETAPTIDWSGTTGDAYWVVVTYRGVGSITTIGTPTTGTSDPETHATISTTIANSMVVLAEMGEDNNNGACTTTGTDPAAYVEHYDETSTGADAMTCFSEATRTAAGATGTVSLDFDTAVPVGWGGVLFVLQPFAAQVGSAPVALGVSPAAAYTVGRKVDTAVSLNAVCPVCVDFAQPSAAAVALAISPDATAINIINKNGPADVSLQVSPAETSVATTYAAPEVSLGLAPAETSIAAIASPAEVGLGVSPETTSVAATYAGPAVSLGVAPEVGAVAETYAALDVALGISPGATAEGATPGGQDNPVNLDAAVQVSPAAGAFAETAAPPAVSLQLVPEVSAFAAKESAAAVTLALAVGVTAVANTPGARKRVVSVVWVI